MQVRGVSWALLLEPEKRPRWWLPQAQGSGGAYDHGEGGAAMSFTSRTNDGLGADVAADVDGADMERLLQLAAAQRMNTEARRAVFCVVMGSEDCADATEKLLRLRLPGKQDREVMRVVTECCLQEKAFNKYYSLLASRLCAVHKQHKFSLQVRGLVWKELA